MPNRSMEMECPQVQGRMLCTLWASQSPRGQERRGIHMENQSSLCGNRNPWPGGRGYRVKFLQHPSRMALQLPWTPSNLQGQPLSPVPTVAPASKCPSPRTPARTNTLPALGLQAEFLWLSTLTPANEQISHYFQNTEAT